MWRCDRHRLLRHQQRWRCATMRELRKPRQLSSSSIRSSPIVLIFYTFPDMLRKSVLKPTLVSLFSILAIYAFFNASLSFFNGGLLVSSSISEERRTPQSSVKIYMYNLPRKFTYGVIENYAIARGDLSNKDSRYPGNQHSAEWWLFADLIREDRPETSPVVTVFDPEEADLFYVPFFSSLSLIVNPIRVSNALENGGLYSDEEMQEDLIRWLDGQQYWKRNRGRDHVFVCQDPNALYKVIDEVKNSVLLVSDFGRLRADQASLVKDVILPYSHRINAYKGEVGVELRKSLLFFMGNRYRKEGGKIRNLLFQVLENEDDVIIKHGTQSRESRRAATQGMHTSKFCLHPAGDTPSACRLFDAIISLCIPVIVSDDIELPFEDAINYRKIAIFVDSTSAVRPGYLINMLKQIKPEKVLEFQHELKEVRHYFEYEDPNGTVREIWRQVALKNQLIKLMINRDKRSVKRDLNDPDGSCICSHRNRTGMMRS